MVTLIDANHANASRKPPPWDRRDRTGLTLSIVVPLVAVLVINGVILSTNGMQNPDYAAVSWDPPGWLVGAIWTVIYPLWGAARWNVSTTDDVRAGRSMWVAALIVWGLCYPVVVSFTGTLGSVIANVFSLLLAIAATIRVWPVSMTAVAMIAPSIIWLCIANALGFAALEAAR
jgi:translocator protein